MKKPQDWKKEWPVAVMLAFIWAVAFLVYPNLPDRVPTHWNLRGEVDGYSGPLFAAFGFPAIITGLALLLYVIPSIDPRRENYRRFADFYHKFIWVFVGFMSVLYLVAIAAGLGKPVDIGLTVMAGVAVLFVFLGNSLGKVRPTYFFGVRTPWTLADEDVWRKTHRWSGRVMVLTGLVPLLAMPFSRALAMGLLLAGVLLLTFGSAVYSFILYRQKQKRD